MQVLVLVWVRDGISSETGDDVNELYARPLWLEAFGRGLDALFWIGAFFFPPRQFICSPLPTHWHRVASWRSSSTNSSGRSTNFRIFCCFIGFIQLTLLQFFKVSGSFRSLLMLIESAPADKLRFLPADVESFWIDNNFCTLTLLSLADPVARKKACNWGSRWW